MMENKRDLSAVVWLRDKSLCSWYLFFAHIQAGDITPGFKPGHHVKAWGIKIIPTQLYSISDIQRVSYCRGYLSGTISARFPLGSASLPSLVSKSAHRSQQTLRA